MTIKSQEQIIRTISNGVEVDRVTVLFEANYLQVPSGDMTHLKWAYDRLVDDSPEPFQADIRLNPGKTVEVLPPGMEIGRFEIAIGHKVPKLSVQVDDILSEQQKLNKIRVYSNGQLVAIVGNDKLFFGQISGKVTIDCDRATTVAHVICYPV